MNSVLGQATLREMNIYHYVNVNCANYIHHVKQLPKNHRIREIHLKNYLK